VKVIQKIQYPIRVTFIVTLIRHAVSQRKMCDIEGDSKRTEG